MKKLDIESLLYDQCLQRFNIQLFHKKNKNTYATQFSSTYEYHSFCTNDYTTQSSPTYEHHSFCTNTYTTNVYNDSISNFFTRRIRTLMRHSPVQHMSIIPSVQTLIRPMFTTIQYPTFSQEE